MPPIVGMTNSKPIYSEKMKLQMTFAFAGVFTGEWLLLVKNTNSSEKYFQIPQYHNIPVSFVLQLQFPNGFLIPSTAIHILLPTFLLHLFKA